MLPSSKRWSEDEVIKITDKIKNSVLIPEQDFRELQCIYRFVYIPSMRAYFDRKWKKVVAKQTKFFKNSDIMLNKDWIITELYRTGSKTLLQLCKTNVELNDVYYRYCEAKKKEWLAFKESLDRRRTRHELEEDDSE